MSPSDETELVGSFAELILAEPEPAIVWPLMLQKLQQVVGFDAGYIGASCGNAAEGRAAVAEHDVASLKQNLGRYLGEMSAEEVARYTGRARVHHDVWSRQRQRELAAFRELLDPTGMRHMIVRASVFNGHVAGFTLERCGASPPYGERELHLVDLVAPFLHIAETLASRSEDGTIALEFAAQHRLTPREREVVALVARGLQNAEIAMLSGVSANTVRNILVKVFEKVGVTNRAELAHVASRPSSDSRHSPVITPPASRLPDDGLQAFASRVAQATGGAPKADAAVTSTFRAGRIAYLPPSEPPSSGARTLVRDPQ